MKAEEVQVEIVAKQKQIELQQQEILRKQRNSKPPCKSPPPTPNATRSRRLPMRRSSSWKPEAAGAATAAKAQGFAAADVAKATGIADAEANKAKGLAQAAIIEAQGAATAETTRLKAEAFQKFNEAAVHRNACQSHARDRGEDQRNRSQDGKMVIINSGNGPGGARAN